MTTQFGAGTLPAGAFSEVGRWELRDLGDLRMMRVALREVVAPGSAGRGGLQDSLPERLLLIANELASNALRHGGGVACVVLSAGDSGWLLDVSDSAVATDPTPATDRTPGEGGYGLYLVQALGAGIGWYEDGARKHVWSQLAAR